MPLKTFDTIDAIPEAHRESAIELKDGKFAISDDSDVAGLRKKNDELMGKFKVAQARAALLGDRTPEDLQADLELAAKAREDKAKAAGDFDAYKVQMKEITDKEIEKERKQTAAEKAKAEAAEGRVHKLLVTDVATRAIRDTGAEEEVLLPHVLAHLKVFDEDGEPVARVVDAKGNVKIADAAGTPMTIPQLIETFRANAKFAALFPASGAAGSGARNESTNNGKPAAVTITAEEGKDVAKYRAAKERATKLGVPFVVQG